ncbi:MULTISPECIES: hypothetical protein [unclassified Streptomyces]|uniref:hypothetical protein n=1 Tax=unclassified Streptomyces TaxID=2593676 RepID=UPI0004CAC12E|nr:MULTISPECIES: hypothetical protein [unclassified Streptomyces]KJY23360.1 hypothetical protein VR43_01720 [Streptomyces sp. NRRL S-104]KOU87614.1 hypothetical protein ADK93_15640 [Streptomyces sp. XY58]KOV06416.1 hypothetical protein ADK89_15005 [Streptomyces sp. XY37]KOV17501.1 hypothetical protein ADK90_24315 [Streptomyces sp. XY413]KOV48662.1 hypothetical protein ADK99_14665 [Streptomyces sp. MMG1064]
MTKTLDLVPGIITNRDEIADSFNCGKAQGIETAREAEKIFLFSDPAAGHSFGYTFDGRADDDEYGPLYLYTGRGLVGDQSLTDRNKTLRLHVEKGYEVHLFVADGKVSDDSDALRQRYIGQMTIDPIDPVHVRRAPDQKKNMRNVLVFRLRPAPGSTPKWLDKDRLQPATSDGIEEIDLDKTPVDVPVIPTQGGVKDKASEVHTVTETVANIPGGPRKVVRRESILVSAFKKTLEEAGHTHKTFQITAKGESGAITPDLYDATDHMLYEAKGKTTRENVRMAIGQLLDYSHHLRKHISDPDNLRVGILLPSEPEEPVKELLHSLGIGLVYQTEDGFHGFPLKP